MLVIRYGQECVYREVVLTWRVYPRVIGPVYVRNNVLVAGVAGSYLLFWLTSVYIVDPWCFIYGRSYASCGLLVAGWDRFLVYGPCVSVLLG
jgi:hypothetical protein